MPDEIDLDEDDEAALDRAWETIAKQDAERKRKRKRGQTAKDNPGHDLSQHERAEDPGPAA